MLAELIPVFTRVIGVIVKYGPGGLGGGSALLDTGPHLQK